MSKRHTIADIDPDDRFAILPRDERMIYVHREKSFSDYGIDSVTMKLADLRRRKILSGKKKPIEDWDEPRHTVFEPLRWDEIATVSMTDVHRNRSGGWIEVPYTAWGDYNGSTVDRSNYEVFKERFADERLTANGRPNWIEARGHYGCRCLYVTIAFYLANETVQDFIDGVGDYPLADEDHHSDLESRLHKEAWEDWAREDLRETLSEVYEGDFPEPAANPFDDERLAGIWPHVIANAVFDSGGCMHEAYESNYPTCEDATSAHWPIEVYAAACSFADIARMIEEAEKLYTWWLTGNAHACVECRKVSAATKHGAQERLFVSGEGAHFPGCHFPGCRFAVSYVDEKGTVHHAHDSACYYAHKDCVLHPDLGLACALSTIISDTTEDAA